MGQKQTVSLWAIGTAGSTRRSGGDDQIPRAPLDLVLDDLFEPLSDPEHVGSEAIL
jgi:hypothetical protein